MRAWVTGQREAQLRPALTYAYLKLRMQPLPTVYHYHYSYRTL